MSYKGKFKPKNYQKYKGNPTNITYRSLLERRFINEVMTWGVNQAKGEAATKYSIERNWEFKIITDKDLR